MTTKKKRPTYYAYSVVEKNGKDAQWIEIGAVWPHGDSKGYNITLNCNPLDGKIVLREISADNKTE
jgi:hypothetical protein